MSFNTPLGDFEPLVVWTAGASPFAIYFLAMAFVTSHAGAELPRATRRWAVALSVLLGMAVGFVVHWTPLFGKLLRYFQDTLVAGVLLALTGVGLIVMLGLPALSLVLAYRLSRQRGGWYVVTLASCFLVAWWVQTLLWLLLR